MKVVSPILTALLALSCSSADNNSSSAEPPTAEAIATYARIVEASYADSHAGVVALDASIDAFLDAPDQSALDAARQAWLDSREPYLQTEVYRFYDGPIDDPDDGPEGLINAWPLDENYIDYTVDEPTGGVINDTSVTIDAATLEGLNEVGGDKNIATGYHAVEFLLWGQDLSETGPGARPVSDYVDAENADRRGLYLQTVSTMLGTHIGSVHMEWMPNGAYRTAFEAADPDESLRKILTGMIVLSGFETGGERLQAALDTGDQEDEHSCFSDNTHRDMVQDVRGVQNVYLGTYTRTDGTVIEGTSIKDVIAAKDAGLADELDAKIAESLSLAEALKTPFDQEISTGNAEGRARVQALITSLREQEGLLEEAFRLFGFDIPAPE